MMKILTQKMLVAQGQTELSSLFSLSGG